VQKTRSLFGLTAQSVEAVPQYGEEDDVMQNEVIITSCTAARCAGYFWFCLSHFVPSQHQAFN
jgi:hypothetical protein